MLFYGAAGFSGFSNDDLISADWLLRPTEPRPVEQVISHELP